MLLNLYFYTNIIKEKICLFVCNESSETTELIKNNSFTIGKLHQPRVTKATLYFVLNIHAIPEAATGYYTMFQTTLQQVIVFKGHNEALFSQT